MQVHDFAFVSDVAGNNSRIELDGIPLKGVTDVVIRASNDPSSPVKVELEFMANIVEPSKEVSELAPDEVNPWFN